MGGFSAAYDLVSAEYGWTDKQIGKLPLARLRQITSAIQIRRYHTTREENLRASWQTRILAGYIANGYMVEKGKPNVPFENAQKLTLDDIEAALLGVSPTGEPGPKENKNGSYERFMMTLGRTGGRR